MATICKGARHEEVEERKDWEVHGEEFKGRNFEIV